MSRKRALAPGSAAWRSAAPLSVATVRDAILALDAFTSTLAPAITLRAKAWASTRSQRTLHASSRDVQARRHPARGRSEAGGRDGEALLRVAAVGVCGSDIPRLLTKGAHRMPIICGHEFSGQIIDIGEGVSGFEIGELVGVAPLLPCRVCDQCLTGNFSRCRNYDYFGSRRDGAYAEFVAAPVANLLKAPSGRRPAGDRDDGPRFDRPACGLEGAADDGPARRSRGLRPDRPLRHPVDAADGMHGSRRGRPRFG